MAPHRQSVDATAMTRQRRISLALGWAGISLSLVGDAFLDFVLLVEAAHGRAGISVGLLGCLIGLPALLAGSVGSWLDRHRPAHRALLGAAMLAGAAATGLLAALWASPNLRVVVYAVVPALGLTAVASTLIWQTLLPHYANNDKDSVRRLVGQSATLIAAAGAVGPVLVALVAARFRPRELVAIDSLSFLVAAGLLAMAVRLAPIPHGLEIPPNSSTSSDFVSTRWAGLRLLLAEPLVRGPMLALSTMNFLSFGIAFAVPLLVVARGWPNSTIAWCSSLLVFGTLLGSALATRFRSDRHHLHYIALEPPVRALGLLAVLVAPWPGLALLGIALFTLPQGLGRVARQSLLLTCFPGSHRARVLGSYQAVVRGAMPLAPLVMGGLVTPLGIDAYLLACVISFLVLGGALSCDRGLRDKWREARANLQGVSSVP